MFQFSFQDKSEIAVAFGDDLQNQSSSAWLDLQNDLSLRRIDLLPISSSPNNLLPISGSPTHPECNIATERSLDVYEDVDIRQVEESEVQSDVPFPGNDVTSGENSRRDAELCDQLCEAADVIIAKTEAIIQKNQNGENSNEEPEKSCEVTVEQLCDAADDVIARSEAMVLKTKTELDQITSQEQVSDAISRPKEESEGASSVLCRSELFVRREDQNLESVRTQLAQIDASVLSQSRQTQTLHLEPELQIINSSAEIKLSHRIDSEVSESSEDVFHDCEEVPVFEDVESSTGLKTGIETKSEIVSNDDNETSDSSSDVSGFHPSVGLQRIDSPMPSLESRYSQTSTNFCI